MIEEELRALTEAIRELNATVSAQNNGLSYPASIFELQNRLAEQAKDQGDGPSLDDIREAVKSLGREKAAPIVKAYVPAKQKVVVTNIPKEKYSELYKELQAAA